jgi:hypothetical protein
MKNSFWIFVLFASAIWIILNTGFDYMADKAFTWSLLLSNIPGGLFMGITFALITKFAKIDPHKRITFELGPEETLIKESGAVKTSKNDRLEGKLGLTDKRIVFKGDRYDTRKVQLSFDLEQIHNLRTSNPWIFVKNEIRFDYTDGSAQRFAVDDTDSWMKAIERQRTNPPVLQAGLL